MPPKKKVAGYTKLQIQAGTATPAPSIGPASGQYGVNIMEFCKVHNAVTEFQRDSMIPVEITVYEDRSFTSVTKTPPAAELIKKAAGVAKGSSTSRSNKVGHLTVERLREIAKAKEPDLNASDLNNTARIIAETARSMGVTSDEIRSFPGVYKHREWIAEGSARVP